MSSLTDSAAIFHYHWNMIALHGGDSSYALGWRDRESQLLRFKVLAGIADLDHHSVFDAGCGYGDLYPFLHQTYPRLSSYCGMEQISELLEEAIRRYSDHPDASFISGNFITGQLPLTDYALACGSLNYASNDPEFIFRAIAKLYGSCRLGFGFNLLSDIAPNDLLVAYEPQLIRDYCLSLTKNVQLKNNYTDDDFTIFMYH